MQKVVDYIKGILGDTDGLPSSKRIVSVIFAVLIGGAFVANLGWDLTIDDNVLDAVMLITIAGLGLTGIEKFANKASDKIKSDK
jgi:hypothetical protein